MERPIDTLTGLISGVELTSEMDALIKKGGEFALVLLDIDMLFALNRDFGLEAGDAVFRLIADEMRSLFPEPSLLFRDTRDQFDILMPGADKEAAFLLSEQLRRRICEVRLPFSSAEGQPLLQTVSVGISSYPDDGSRSADVLRRADSALMRAKKSGRNRVCLAKEEKLIPKTSHYTSAQLERLSETAEKVGVGEAALLREALDDLLRKYDVN